MRIWFDLLTLPALLMLAGVDACTPPAGLATPQPMAESAAGAPRPASAPALRPGDGAVSLDAMVAAARADAATHSGLDDAALQVLSAEHVTWRDGSLGCPQSDRSYTMALVNGYRIRIQAGAQVFDYHAGTRGGLLLCPAGRAVDPLPAGRI
jgi:hypothetical protein